MLPHAPGASGNVNQTWNPNSLNNTMGHAGATGSQKNKERYMPLQ